jgi:hypothetical protein
MGACGGVDSGVAPLEEGAAFFAFLFQLIKNRSVTIGQ